MKKLLIAALLLALMCPAFGEQAADIAGTWYLESIVNEIEAEPYFSGEGAILPGVCALNLNEDGTGEFLSAATGQESPCVWTADTLKIGQSENALSLQNGKLIASRGSDVMRIELVFTRNLTYSILPEAASAESLSQLDGVYTCLYTIGSDGFISPDYSGSAVVIGEGACTTDDGTFALSLEDGALKAKDESTLVLNSVVGASTITVTNVKTFIFRPTRQAGVIFCDVCDDVGTLCYRDVYVKKDAGSNRFTAFAGGNNADERLARAFENDALRLTQVELPISAENFAFDGISDEALSYFGLDRASLEAAIESLEPAEGNYVSLSPSGNSGMIAVGNNLIAMYDGRYHLLYPAYGRGVEDVNHTFEMSFDLNIGMGKRLNYAGVAYSPDGRYAVLCDGKNALRNLRGQELMLIDLKSGEVTLIASYGSNLFNENFGLVTAAEFSNDGKGLYYLAYRSGYSSLRYIDLATLEDTPVIDSPDGTRNTMFGTCWYYPCIAETQNGGVLLLSDVSRRDLPQALARLGTEDGIKYSLTAYQMPANNMYLSTDMLSFSKASNRGIIVSTRGHVNYQSSMTMGQNGVSFPDLFVTFTADETMGGIDAAWAIEYGADRAERFDISKIESDIDYDSRFAYIYKAVLSPDGEYALMLTSYRRERRLMMLRLDDMALREVSGIDANTIIPESALSMYLPTIEWNGDTLILSTEDGPVTCRFEW